MNYKPITCGKLKPGDVISSPLGYTRTSRWFEYVIAARPVKIHYIELTVWALSPCRPGRIFIYIVNENDQSHLFCECPKVKNPGKK